MWTALPVLLGLWACGGDDPSPPGTTAAATAETGVPLPTATVSAADLDVLRQRFEGMGFQVGEGRAGMLPLAGCCGWISCFKWNPSSAYVLWFLPLAPGESAVGRELDADGRSWYWRLRPDEAVVRIGPTPPPMRYHSMRTYVHSSWSDALQTHVPAFDNLGDSLNQLVMHTEGDAPWNAMTVVISTADAGTEARVREALVGAGYPEAWINTDVIPAEQVELGLHDEADTLRMLHRVALFDDPAAGDAWLAAPPDTVWRLTPSTQAPSVPLEVPPYRSGGRAPGDDESALAPAVEALAEAIVAAHPELLHVEAPVNTRELDLTEACWSGCNRDSHQSNIAAVDFPDGSDHFMVAFGVNHHATGRASYQNAIVFGVDNDDPAAWVDDPSFEGSARHYLPDHPDADLLYAWTFTRDCDGRPFCSELVDGCPGLSPGEKAAIHFRSYLDPETGVAPLAEELLSERVLVFKPPAPETTP